MECNQEVCSSWLQRRPDTFICQGRSHKWCRASLTDESIWSKAQPRGISRSLPRRKTGLASNTKKSYIKSKSHCLIFYQSIVGGLYTIISEGKFTQSKGSENLDLKNIFCYNTDVAGATSVRRSSQAVRRGSATPWCTGSNPVCASQNLKRKYSSGFFFCRNPQVLN